MAFEDHVFINCPFDDQYRDLLRPLLFTVVYLGFVPRIALERLNAGETRFEKICQLIEESKYAIHDLSRMEASEAGELFRLNMPFELGLFIGCAKFGEDHSGKECLVLEAKRYRYQAAISDLSNSDIVSHNNDPEQVVEKVRDWLCARLSHRTADGPAKIWASFMEFMAITDEDLTANGFSKAQIARLPELELIDRMQTWVASIS